jgi:hypothetical protein
MHRSPTYPLPTAFGLKRIAANPAADQIVDQGVVVVRPNDNLRIGIAAFGQREVTNAMDGPYSAITLGEAVGDELAPP